MDPDSAAAGDGHAQLPEHATVAVASEPPSSYLPALQLSHALLTPAVTLYLPASQLAQTVEALAAEYLPASQLAQTVKFVAGEYLPASQLLQAVAALAPEYVPAGHGLHSVPLLPK